MNLLDLNERQYTALSQIKSIGYQKGQRQSFMELRKEYKEEIRFLLDNGLAYSYGRLYCTTAKGREIISQKLFQCFTEHMGKNPVQINGFSEFEKYLPINKYPYESFI